jgi:ELWxxDGT repeat protein
VELYVTNGTIAGTYLVKDILPGALSGFNTEHGGTAGAFGDGSFVFTAIDGYLSNGISDQQIWISDGTAAGTYKLSSSSAGYNARALHVDREANLIFFFAGTPDTGMELWRSAGTVSTTQLVKDLCPGSCSGAASGHELGTILSIMSLEDGQIMFRGSNGASGGEPVVSDGTPQGTYLIDLVAGSGGSSPLLFGSLSAGRAFIYANNNTHGHEPWVVSTQ